MSQVYLSGQRSRSSTSDGFSLPELLCATAIISVLAALAVPAFTSLYEGRCVKAAVMEIAGMIKETKYCALSDGKYFAIGFDPAAGKVSLIAARGADGTWNTDDDQIVRSFRLTDKGGGVRFGYGGHGPLPGLAATEDGVTFQSNNTLVCNPDLTGNAGTVYLVSRGGAAMALTMNSRDFSYTLWCRSGRRWVRI